MQRCVCQQLFTLSEVPVLGKKEPHLQVEFREVLSLGKPWVRILGTQALVLPWKPGLRTSCRGRRPRLQACLSISLPAGVRLPVLCSPKLSTWSPSVAQDTHNKAEDGLCAGQSWHLKRVRSQKT